MGISYEPFYGAKEVLLRVDNKREEMVKAFLTFCSQRRNPVFGKSLSSWVKGRLSSGLPVDPDEPDLKKPSEEFRTEMLKAFNAKFRGDSKVRQSKPTGTSAKK